MPSSRGRAPNTVGNDGSPALGRLRPGTTPPPKGVAVLVGTTFWLPFAVIVANTVCAVATVLVDPKGLAVVAGTTLLPFAVVVADADCAVATVLVDPKGLAVVAGTTLLPFAVVVADADCAVAPSVER